MRLGLPVDREFSVENFVAAMFAVGLCKHHQLYVGRVALELGERCHQITDFVFCQRQTPAFIGILKGLFTSGQHIDLLHGCGLKLCE